MRYLSLAIVVPSVFVAFGGEERAIAQELQDERNQTVETASVATTENVGLESIIVTAQRRRQSAQDVPISLAALSAEKLWVAGAKTPLDLMRLAPNFSTTVTNPLAIQLNIRGVGSNDFFGNQTGSVGLYLDEITIGVPFLTSLAMFDLERVEILRGPQNDLFGRNTTAGAVSYITRKPIVGSKVGGTINIEYGNFNALDFEGGVNIPLTDDSALRIAAMTYQRDGIWRNLADNGRRYGESSRYAGRLTWVWEPDTKTSLTVSGQYGAERSQAPPFKFSGVRGTNGSPNFFTTRPGIAFEGALAIPEEPDFKTDYGGYNAQGRSVDTINWQDIYRVTNDDVVIDTYGFNIRLEYDLDFVLFTSLSSYNATDVQFAFDYGGPGATPNDIVFAPYMEQYYEQVSQELRFDLTQFKRIKWFGGVLFLFENTLLSQAIDAGPGSFDTNQPLTFEGAPPLPGQPVGGNLAALFLLGDLNSNQALFSVADQENFVVSPYMHAEWEFLRDLTLTVGVRYTLDHKVMHSLRVANVPTLGLAADQFRSRSLMEGLAQGLPLCDLDGDLNRLGLPNRTPDNAGVPCSQVLYPENLTFHQVGGKIGLSWQPNRDFLFYGHYSRGFRSGKFDIDYAQGPQTGFTRQDQRAEKLDAVEAGIKTMWFDRRIRLNLSAFIYHWHDQIVRDVDPAEGPTSFNIDRSRILGLELDGSWRIASLYLQGGVGLLSSEILDDGDDSADRIEEGHELPFAPALSVNGSATYDQHLGDTAILRLHTDVNYRSRVSTGFREKIVADSVPSQLYLNARIGIEFGEDARFYFGAYARNLTDTEVCQTVSDFSLFSGVILCLPNEGRRFMGVDAQFKF